MILYINDMKRYKVAKMKKDYIHPSCELLLLEALDFFCTSTHPTTSGSSEPDYDNEEEKEWGEIEF